MRSDVCVLMATYNRPDWCERSLRSLLAAFTAASELNFEILVGVNGPDPSTSRVLEKILHEAGPSCLRIIQLTERLTPSACRNRLLESVQADWIYFVDDDAYVDTFFFKRWLKSPLRERCDAVGGPNLNPPDSNFFQKAASVALASPFATYFSSSRYRAQGSARMCAEESLILCNLFVKREALPQTPFLDELQCAEENWLLQNLKRGHHELGYDPGLGVWHERRPGLLSFARQVFKYGFGRGQIFRRRPSGLRPAHVLPVVCVLYTLALPAANFGAWFLPYPLYAVLCCVFAARGEAPLSIRLAGAPLFPVIHVAYAGGLVWGAVTG